MFLCFAIPKINKTYREQSIIIIIIKKQQHNIGKNLLIDLKILASTNQRKTACICLIFIEKFFLSRHHLTSVIKYTGCIMPAGLLW